MLLAATAETLKDLGVPTIIGAVIGAVIGHYTAKARSRDDRLWARDLLLVQDERRSAQLAYASAREVRNRINRGVEESELADLHNQIRDTVEVPVRLIRDDEINDRVDILTNVVFLAMITPGYWSYVLLRASLDVEQALEAWIRSDPFPAAHMPKMDEIRKLIRPEDGRDGPTFDRLSVVLSEQMERLPR